ncbi:MAG: gamma-glutamylcyclotransferase [Planctomycetaceae bacterium]|nr:gamma-glutamylcyclotransferase [Planctomycetaceae bacterium]
MAEQIYYFAYGSNLHPVRLEARIGASQIAGVAQLPGAELCFHKVGRDRSGKCDIVCRESTSATVWGVVYQISVGQKKILDQHESLGQGYQILETFVFTRQEQKIPVYTYQAMSDYIDPSLKPFDWYHELVVQGALFHGFPTEYLAELRKTELIPDSDFQRADLHQSLLRTIQETRHSERAE